MTTMTRFEATRAGFHPLTTGYRLPDEQWMLDNVLADMRRGGITHVLVKQKGSVAVWRGGFLKGIRQKAGCRRTTGMQRENR